MAALALLSTTAFAGLAWADRAAAQPDSSPNVVKGVTVTGVLRQKPTGAPPPLEIFATPTKFEQIALSPDGSQLAFVTSYQGMRLLVAYRFADKTRRAARLNAADPISTISWADADHVLVTVAKSGLRGTCDAGDERAIEVNVNATNMAVEGAMSTQSASGPGSGAQGPTPEFNSTLMSLQTSMGAHPCVYYGVRSQSAITWVDLAHQTGRGIGLRFGDHTYRPLGVPTPFVLDGKRELAGPFLELRDQAAYNEPAERVYLWGIDPKTGVGRFVDDHGGDLSRIENYVDDWLIDPKGEIVARGLYDFGDQTFSIQMRSGGRWKPVLKRKIEDKAHTFAPFLIGLGRSPSSIVILDAGPDGAADGTGRSFHYYELDADGRVSGPLEPDDAARDRPIIDARTARVSGWVQDGAGETYALSDPYLQSLYERALDAVPGETVRVVSTADDPRKMIIYASGHEDPGGYYLLDFSEGTSESIGEDYAAVPSEWYAPQAEITYKAADGLEINALLTLPTKPTAQHLPLVVLPHDELQGHDRLGFDWLAQALASRGYLVLQPQYRGSDGYGRAYMEAGYGQLGRKMQSDLSDGVRYLVEKGLADPKRACILGEGWGGYAALLAAETDAATYRCAGAINGVTDPDAFAGWLKKREVQPDEDLITSLTADPLWPRAFKANPLSPQILARYAGGDGAAPSPVKQADAVSIPVLIVSGQGDLAKQSRAMRDALLERHKSVQFAEVKPGEHDLTPKETRLQTLTAVMDFLAKYNPGE